MKKLLIGILCLSYSFGSLAINLKPDVNAELKFFPAATNCSMGSSTKTPSKIPIAYANQGSLQVWEGDHLFCSLPIKQGRYIERIVLDFSANGMLPRQCKVGFVRAAGGSAVANSMTLEKDNGIDVWYYDDLGIGGSFPFYGSNSDYSLLLDCQHWNFTGTSWMRYGVIRIDYTPSS